MTDTDNPIRVLLIDDHSKIHLALSRWIEAQPDMVLVGQGSNGQEAITLCDEYQPDVVLMDIIMPQMDGIAAARAILAKHPHIKILALSGFQDRDSVQTMLEAGAVGYVLKQSGGDDLANAIRTAASGQTVLSREVMQTLLTANPSTTPQTRARRDYGLTRRELDVLQHLVAGRTNNEIADLMTVSLSTVKFHVSNLLKKLDAATRTEAVARAVEENLVD